MTALFTFHFSLFEMQIHYGTENLQIVNPVVTIGSFDGVHKGHVQVIESLKRVARNLKGETVIISFEPHPREVLYPMEKRPGILTTLEEKAAILATYGVNIWSSCNSPVRWPNWNMQILYVISWSIKSV